MPLHARSHPDLRKTGSHPDYWYPLARSKSLKRGKTLAVRFAGQPIVLARTKTGKCFALENRCAHRQVPLAAGVVIGEELKCCYHGWSYDATGSCVGVPYLRADEALPNGVRSYPCREAYGLVFVYPGDLSNFDKVAFPEVPAQSDSHYKTRYLDRQVECHYSFMHENLMDMNHQFMHRRLMGSIQTTLLALRPGSRSVEVDYTFARKGGGQPLGEKLILGQAMQDRKQDLMTIRTDYPYQTLKFWTAGSEHPALDLWNVYVPVDTEQRINHTLGLMMIRKPPVPGLMHLLWPAVVWFTEGIFRQDRWIVEQEQRAFDAQGEDQNQEIFPAILCLRKVLREGGVPIGSSTPRPRTGPRAEFRSNSDRAPVNAI